MAGLPGLRLPNWRDVEARDDTVWQGADLRIDTAFADPEVAAARIAAKMEDA
ncbi:hypothetical protein [Salipiger sp. PrR002]|uniref:hypothetical protein n=1 Tax=Salipiger sp. PrR002 TaxID=2706489 RepID=UPI0013BB2193|nr:hypothetical protein [Salipiger sp. PrR002]NDV97874.1 hypothetical protein [Salipiger sp. PrR002]NDW55365.1 hypothetical protein [Salipiger sp. PrR004]